jgi:hypothetical protein
MDESLRKCKKCLNEKIIAAFRPKKSSQDGISLICRTCLNRQCRELRNAKKRYATASIREKGLSVNDYNSKEEWSQAINSMKAEAIAEFIKNKPVKNVKNSEQWKAGTRLRSQLRLLIKNISQSKRIMELMGCDHQTLKAHLEKQFQSGMTWENYGRHGWHIDHIKPCRSFDLTIPEEQCKCFHYTNLQPLWALDNHRKGFRY